MARTDDAIKGDVIAALAASPGVQATEVQVDVDQGKVYLLGIVDDVKDRTAASEIARDIPGVVSVENDLTISSDGTLTDLEIECEASELLEKADMPEVGVRVEAGTIYLMGVVSSLSEKQEAIGVASAAKGARDVLSELEIAAGEPIDDTGLANAVIDTLSEDPRISALDLDVESKDGTVLLRGQVIDPRELELASEVAGTVPGVRRVENHMQAS